MNHKGMVLLGAMVALWSLLPGGTAGAGIDRRDIRSFRYGTDSEKLAVLRRVASQQDKVYLPEVASLLDDPSKEIRSAAAETLLKAGDATCTPYYRKALTDPWWLVRLYGIRGMAIHGAGDIVPDFLKALDDLHWQVRFYGAVGLGKHGDAEVMEGLIAHLEDRNVKVREQILWALTRILWSDTARARFKKLDQGLLSRIFGQLGSTEISLRVRGIWVMEASGDVRCVPELVKMLEDVSPEVRIQGVWALERMKATGAAEALEALLEDESFRVKLESIKALVRLDLHESLEGLVRKLQDPDVNVRIHALWALERMNEPGTYAAIANALSDPAVEVKQYAVRVVETLRSPEFLPLLVSVAENGRVAVDDRVLALAVLGRTGDGSLKDFFLRTARNPDPRLRLQAVDSLFRLTPLDPDLLRLLVHQERSDPDGGVRRKAASLLGEAMRQVDRRLRGRDAASRSEALALVESFDGAKGLKSLLRTMGISEYSDVRETMAILAEKNPDSSFGAALRQLMEDPDIETRRAAAAALGRVKDRRSLTALRQGLKSYDAQLQMECALALALMGGSEGVPVALRYLNGDNVAFQLKAAEVLGRLKRRDALNVLLRTLADAELEVRLTAAWALARMGESRGIQFLVKLSEESVEPLRTRANEYLKDTEIPMSLARQVPTLREQYRRQRLGVQEISPRMAAAFRVTGAIAVDARENDRFWQTVKKENRFIYLAGEKIPADVQTRFAVGYDREYLYILALCDDPQSAGLTLDSRDFITVSLNPSRSFKEWYQFVIHPTELVQYSYVWMHYADNEDQWKWVSSWKVKARIEASQWIAEMAIPLKDLGVEQIRPGDTWNVNFQRDSDHLPVTTWTGRIDNTEQFGVLVFEETVQ